MKEYVDVELVGLTTLRKATGKTGMTTEEDQSIRETRKANIQKAKTSLAKAAEVFAIQDQYKILYAKEDTS